jgi:hypothetical protein
MRVLRRIPAVKRKTETHTLRVFSNFISPSGGRIPWVDGKPKKAIANKFSKGIIDPSGLGMLGRRLASVNTGAFRFFRASIRI